MGLWPILPGFIRQIRLESTENPWDHLFQLTYFVGFGIAFGVHWLLHTVFPVPGQSGGGIFWMKWRGGPTDERLEREGVKEMDGEEKGSGSHTEVN